MLVPTKALRFALSGIKALAAKDEDEVSVFSDTPLDIVAARTVCRQIVYATKPAFVVNTLASGFSLPSDVAVFSRSGLIPRSYADIVSRESASHKGRVLFVGDLEPLAIAAYLSLLVGGIDRSTARTPGKVTYCGIADAWLELCEREIRPELREPRVAGFGLPMTLCTRMTDSERRLLGVIEGAGIVLEEIVGRNGAALLRAGCTVDLATASAPEKFRGGFMSRLWRRVLTPPSQERVGVRSPDARRRSRRDP